MPMWERTGFYLRKTLMRSIEQNVRCMLEQINKRVSESLCIMCFLVVIMPVMSERADASDFYMQRPQLAFTLSYEYDKDIRTTSSNKSELSANRFREGIEISTGGWVYHPALMVYSLEYTPEWEQSDSTSLSRENTFFNGFSADMTFLKFKPYTLNVYAKRTSSRIRSDLAETTRLNVDDYGAQLFLKYRVLPVVFSYTHLDSDQSGFFEADTVRDTYNLRMSHIWKRSATSLSAFYSDLRQKTNDVIQDGETRNIDLKNSIAIIKNNKLTLISSLVYEESFSTYNDDEIYRVRETVLWNHKHNLSTRYTFNYEERDRFDKRLLSSVPRKATVYRFNLNHRLYENLSTGIQAGFDDNKTGGNREQQYDAGIFWDYRRRIPWGTLGIDIGQSYSNVKVLESEDFVSISDEAYTINDLSFTFISNANVDDNSIFVFDKGGIRLVNGFHYDLVSNGAFTGIRCRPVLPDCSGPDGVDVLIDYRFRNKFPFDYSIRDQSYGIQLKLWSVLDVFYRFSTSTQKFLRGTRPDDLSKDTIHRTGAGLEWKGTDTTIEFEDISSVTGLSSRRLRVTEFVNLRTDREWLVNILASYAMTEFPVTGETVRVSNIRAHTEKLVMDNGLLKADAFIRNVRSDSEDLNEFGISAMLNWMYNIYDIDLTYMFNNEKNSVIDYTVRNHYILLEIRRNLY